MSNHVKMYIRIYCKINGQKKISSSPPGGKGGHLIEQRHGYWCSIHYTTHQGLLRLTLELATVVW